MDDALGLARGAGGVEQVQRVFGVERFRGVGGGLLGDDLVPPHVALGVPSDVDAGAADDEDLLHRGGGAIDARQLAPERLVDRGLERRGLTTAELPVGGDDDLRLRVVDAGAQRGGGEPGEHDRVGQAEARAGEHRDIGLGDHRHIDGDAVAGDESERGEVVRRARDIGEQVGIGDVPGVGLRLADPVDCNPVAVAGLHVAVDAVDRDVELSADEPLRHRSLRPVENLGPFLVP